jgi:hypothetical protein
MTPDEATWEDADFIHQEFPQFKPWGLVPRGEYCQDPILQMGCSYLLSWINGQDYPIPLHRHPTALVLPDLVLILKLFTCAKRAYRCNLNVIVLSVAPRGTLYNSGEWVDGWHAMNKHQNPSYLFPALYFI